MYHAKAPVSLPVLLMMIDSVSDLFEKRLYKQLWAESPFLFVCIYFSIAYRNRIVEFYHFRRRKRYLLFF